MPPPKGPVVSFPADLFDLDPQLRALARHGRDARALRDLYTQMWFHARKMHRDGVVPAEDIVTLAHPDSARAARRDVERLVSAGVVERTPDGYRVRAYLDTNPSWERENSLAAAKGHGAQKANHERWHVRRKEADPHCSLCQITDQSTDQTSDQYSDQSTDEYSDRTSDRSSDNGVFATEAVLLEITPPIVPPTAVNGDGDDPAFTEFWQAYPRKVGKPRSRQAWRRAMKKHHDPALITVAAERYATDCEHERREPRFIAHPSTWLNDERYLDAEEAPGGNGDDEDFWSQ